MDNVQRNFFHKDSRPESQTFRTSTLRLSELTSSAEIWTLTFPHQNQIVIATSFHVYDHETVTDSAAAGTF
jgi:hypothetical protein